MVASFIPSSHILVLVSSKSIGLQWSEQVESLIKAVSNREIRLSVVLNYLEFILFKHR